MPDLGRAGSRRLSGVIHVVSRPRVIEPVFSGLAVTYAIADLYLSGHSIKPGWLFDVEFVSGAEHAPRASLPGRSLPRGLVHSEPAPSAAGWRIRTLATRAVGSIGQHLNYDVIVIGAGATGMMCAIEAGRRGRSVLILERNDQVGRKILISGGGRCNFTNINAEPENYFSQNPDFCRSALASYPPAQFISLVEQHGIPYHEKKLGQLFCDGSSREIVTMLEAECVAAGAEIRVSCEVSFVAQSDGFCLETNLGAFESQSLVVASGGISIPQIGATSFGYKVAQQFGLKRVTLRPGLVPLTWSDQDQVLFESLNGVALEATVSCGNSSFTENILFTQRGLSGPAILQISNAWREGEAIMLDLFPRISMPEILAAWHDQPRQLSAVLSDYAPRRFVQAWCEAYTPSQPLNRYSRRQIDEIAQRLHAWELRPAGTAGFGKAEVTLGGVDTNGLKSKTMEARRVPGLFFIGEVVDVTGWLGGYNFQWAWASGFAAGQVA